jgi:hypothetical protein
LLGAEAGHDWLPLARIDRSNETWQQKACAEGFTGTHDRLALVVVDDSLDAAFERRQREGDDELPEWMRPSYSPEQQGGRGRMHRGTGFSPLPEAARPLAMVEIVTDGNPPPIWPIRPFSETAVYRASFTTTDPSTP